MKSLISSLITRKPTGFTSTLRGLFVALIVLGFGPNLDAGVTLGPKPILSLSQAHRAVWRIQSNEPRSHYDAANGDSQGTTFAIASDLFITNFHVFNLFIHNRRSITDIYLVQEGNSTAIKVKGVYVVSGVYDLVLFQTTTKIDDYLPLADKNFSLEQKEHLILIGYPQGSFAISEPIEQGNGTIDYEDNLNYGFGTTISNLQGASGGPILNSRGEVVGVFHTFYENVAYGTKIKHFREFLENRKPGEVPTRTKRTLCSQPNNPQQCIVAEKNNVRTLAKNLDTLALFQMGLPYSYINESMRRMESFER